MNYRSYHDISLAIWNYIPDLPMRYDLIVGIPQSGMIPAVMLSSYLKVNLSSLDLFVRGNCMTKGKTRTDQRHLSGLQGVRNVLVIDDSIYHGDSIREARQRIESAEILKKYRLHIDYAAVYSITGKDIDADFSFAICPVPRVFQWNIFNHPVVTKNSCYDIDGVVCKDPTPEQNDDGPEYAKFLATASKRINIQFPVGAFVSSRLEKYRRQTEEWLKNSDFKWNDLVLLDLPTKAARIARNAHAAFKAEVYKNRSETLFVESEWKQALEIARLSGKDVFCTETMAYIEGAKVGAEMAEAERKAKEMKSEMERLCAGNEARDRQLAEAHDSIARMRSARDEAREMVNKMRSARDEAREMVKKMRSARDEAREMVKKMRFSRDEALGKIVQLHDLHDEEQGTVMMLKNQMGVYIDLENKLNKVIGEG